MNTELGDKVMGSRPPRPDGSRPAWVRFTVTRLEADLAYFNARMELIGNPSTTNQKAQISTFRLLDEALNNILHRLKRKSRGMG